MDSGGQLGVWHNQEMTRGYNKTMAADRDSKTKNGQDFMVAETQNEDRESGQTSFVLRASETKRMVRSLTGIETLPVGWGGVR